MQLVKTVRKGEDVIGVMIELSPDTVLAGELQLLHAKEIFDGLIADGWKYVGFPYDFTKHGTTLQNFPDVIEFNSLPEDIRYDFYETTDDRYTNEELMDKLVSTDDAGTAWEPPLACKINTRAELINFLMVNKHTRTNVSDPITFMPLNSFTAKEALLSVEEYMNADNKALITAIENRRRLSFDCYRELVKIFRNMGMPENYDYFTFIEYYNSWGVCGIGSKYLSQKRERLPYTMRNKDVVASAPFFNEIPAVIDRQGVITPPPQPGQVFKKFTNREYNQKYIDNLLPSLAEGELFPITLKEPGFEEVLVYQLIDGEVKYNVIEQGVSMLNSTYVKYYGSIQVQLPSGRDMLPVELYNYKDAETLKKIYNRSWISALILHACKKLRINSDATSVRALQVTGMSIPNAVLYCMVSNLREMLSNDDSGGSVKGMELDEKVYAEKEKLRGLRELALGKIREEENPNLYNDLQEIYERCLEGHVLIDSLAKLNLLDSRLDTTEMYKVLDVAVNTLEIEPREILQSINEAIANKNTEVVLRSQSRNVKLLLPRADNQYSGFLSEVSNYIVKANGESEIWAHVTEVYSEPKQKDKVKHAAIRYLEFKHTRPFGKSGTATRYPDIESVLLEAIDGQIYRAGDDKRQQLNKQRYIFLCDAVFAIAVHGQQARYHVELGNAPINPLPSLVVRVRECCRERIETCAALCDSITDTSGSFSYYFNNVILTPEVVLPRANAEDILERPFYLMCIDVTKEKTPADAQRWASLNYIPNAQYTGMIREYCNLYGVSSHVDIAGLGRYAEPLRCLQTSPYSLIYHYNYLNSYAQRIAAVGFKKLDAFLSCAQHAYGEYVSPAPEEETVSDQPVNFFELQLPRMINNQSVKEEWPDLTSSLIEAHVIEADSSAVSDGVLIFKEFSGFTAEDMVFLKEDVVFDISRQFEGKIPVAVVSGVVAIFTDEKEIDASVEDMTKFPEYAIFTFQNTVLVAAKDGTIYRRG